MVSEMGKVSDARHWHYIQTSIMGIEPESIKRTIARFEGIWETIKRRPDEWRKKPDELKLGRWYDLQRGKTE